MEWAAGMCTTKLNPGTAMHIQSFTSSSQSEASQQLKHSVRTTLPVSGYKSTNELTMASQACA